VWTHLYRPHSRRWRYKCGCQFILAINCGCWDCKLRYKDEVTKSNLSKRWVGPNIGEIWSKWDPNTQPPFILGPHDYFASILKILRLELKQEMNPQKNHGPNPRWSLLLYHSWRNKIWSSSLSCSCFSPLHDFFKNSRLLPHLSCTLASSLHCNKPIKT